MEVTHVVRQYYPAIGGLENFVKALAEEQARKGMTVKVVSLDKCYSTKEKFNKKELINGVEIIRIGFIGSKRYPIAPSVLKYVKHCDLVHVHCTDFFSDYLSLTRSLFKKPLVLTTHGGFFHTEFAGKLKTLYFKTITRASLARFSAVLASSVNDYDRFSSISSSVTLLENGVDVARFIQKEKKTTEGVVKFVFVGRLSVNKRVSELIDWFIALSSGHANWRLQVIGNDYDGLKPNLLEKIETASVTNQISIKSGLADEEVEEELLSSHFIVSASAYEGFGMTIIEGMSAGLIPIVSDIPSFRRIVTESGNGYINEFTSANGQNECKKFIKSSLDNFERESFEVREFSKRYSWQSVERSFYEEYRKALGDDEMVIHGVTIRNFSSLQAIEYIEQSIESENKLLLAFANAHTINEANSSLEFKNALEKFTVLPDGVGVDLAAKYKYGQKFKENLNGTDFVPAFLKQSYKKRIFLVGGKEGIAEKVLAIWSSRYPHHEWVGAHHGYLTDSKSVQLSKEVSELDIDVLIVAMGNPKQELWISEFANLHDAKISIGVGALFDFVAGEAKRAPKWVRRFRLEWVYRLYKEPIRLGKRYLIGNPAFIIRTLFPRKSK